MIKKHQLTSREHLTAILSQKHLLAGTLRCFIEFKFCEGFSNC